MKSVLIIDTPEKCADCPCDYEWANMCRATREAITNHETIQDWCPLLSVIKYKQDEINNLITVSITNVNSE